MQGSFSLPQRLSLQSLATLHSYRNFGVRSVGFCTFPHWQGLEFESPEASYLSARSICRRTSHRVGNESPLQRTVTGKGLAFVGNTGNTGNTGKTNMAGNSFAATPSCSYKTEVTRGGLNWTIATSGKSCGTVQKSSCGIPKPFQRNTALQWLSLHTQRGYAQKPLVSVAGKTGGQEVLVKEGEFEFKRIVSESDSITTFYSSDISSSSSDDEIEEDKETAAGNEKQTKAAKACAEDSDSESDDDDDGEKGTLKKAKKVESLQKTESGMKGLGKYDDMTMSKGEIVGKCEESDSESEDESEEFLQTKEEKNAAKADIKLKEKLEKDSLKAMKKEEKKLKKEAKKLEEKSDSEDDGDKKMKLDYKGKDEEESDSDSESDDEEECNSKVKTKTKTKLKISEDLASDSEYEEADDGVTDFADDFLAEDEETFVITEDETAALEIQNELADEIEEKLEDVDEDDDFWDEDEADVVVGDGGTGGGVVLGGTAWGKKALDLAEQVVAECGKDLSIFACKVSPDNVIRVRLDKLSDRYGSPTMTDIETFSKKFSIVLEEYGEAGTMPKDIDVEVSSPGAERVVRVPNDLERFRELPMYVQYLEGETDLAEKDGVLELDSLDMEAGLSVWKIANVKLNREVKGRGRPLNSKQKKWRATVPFSSLKQVRLYLDV